MIKKESPSLPTWRQNDPLENFDDEDVRSPPIHGKLKDNFVSLTNDSEVSEIKRMFDELSNCKGRLIGLIMRRTLLV